MTHFQAQALSADSPPGELERLLGMLILRESDLLRVKGSGLYLSRRQRMLLVREDNGTFRGGEA